MTETVAASQRRGSPPAAPDARQWRRRAFASHLLVGAATFVAPHLAIATDEQSPESAIRRIIELQLQAFRTDSAQDAYALASPSIQQRFGSPSRFMQMVRGAYPAVYRPSRVVFDELRTIHGVFTQKVYLWDRDGRAYAAYYAMSFTEALGWRIAGCELRHAGDKVL